MIIHTENCCNHQINFAIRWKILSIVVVGNRSSFYFLLLRRENFSEIFRGLLNESSLTWHPINFTNLFALSHRHSAVNEIEERRNICRVLSSDLIRWGASIGHRSVSPPIATSSIFLTGVNSKTRQWQSCHYCCDWLPIAFRQPKGSFFVRFKYGQRYWCAILVCEFELVGEKSIEHRWLEEALRQNKESVAAGVEKSRQ